MAAVLLDNLMKVAVVTSTIGTDFLEKCIESVHNQDYENIQHYIFVDGKSYFPKTRKILSGKKVKRVFLEDNTGSQGWLGHRVYAACSFLVNADLICYLDEDNWFEPNHVSTLLSEIKAGKDWAFSFRKIYTKDGDYLFEDNCESLGKWPVYTNPNLYHIDTSSYMVKTSVATQIGHTWHKQWDADRQFFANLKHFFPNFGCTKTHSLCYRLGGNPNSVSKEFLEQGNYLQKLKYNKLPWS
jgi:glycosyltransferase involved in cell wall biosynthesis